MAVHARPRPKLTTTVRAFEAQGNRQLFPATLHPSVPCPPHLQVDAYICRLTLTRRRKGLYGEQNCHATKYMQNRHKPMHFNGCFTDMNALSSLRLQGLNVKNHKIRKKSMICSARIEI
jgi:hypothetical protein